MTLAYVGLGANLGDPRRQLQAALEELDRLPQTRVTASSGLYRSAPLGHAEQADFVNAVAKLETGLAAAALLAKLLDIEKRQGRERSFRNAPRRLDLDLLLYGEATLATSGLTLPHPRMHQRAFVLKPLAEIAPELTIPGRGKACDLLLRCSDQVVEKIG